MEAITEKGGKTLKLTKFDSDNTMIVGNNEAAQFDHLVSLIKVNILSCKTSCEKIKYLTLCPCEWQTFQVQES